MKTMLSKTAVKWILFTTTLIFLSSWMVNINVGLIILKMSCRPVVPVTMLNFNYTNNACTNTSKWRTLDDLLHQNNYILQKRSHDETIQAWSTRNKEPSGRYAVFSASTRGHPNTNALYLILTVLAWRRIQKESIIVISGDIAEWQERPTLRYVIENIVKMKVTLILLHTQEHDIIISQTGRLFVANMLKWENEEKTYLISTDTDLLPLKSDFYNLSSNRSIMVLNSDCCGHFTRENIRYKFLPISNVIMSVKTWKNVMTPYNRDPKNAKDIINYITEDLGNSRSSKLHVGRADEIVWNADQIIISMRIHEWEHKNSQNHTLYYPRWLLKDRIDRNLNLYKFPFAKDVHLARDLFKSTADIWWKLEKLLSLMYGSKYETYWTRLFNQYKSCISVEGTSNNGE